MASGCKTNKAELVAIYRLEFYRKQKNWKFCRKEKAKQTEDDRDQSSKPELECLNKTYRVHAKDDQSLLNQAFLGPTEEEDNTAQTDPPKKPKEASSKPCKKHNKAYKKEKKTSGIDTLKPSTVDCEKHRVPQKEQHTKDQKISNQNFTPEKTPQDIFQALPNNFETCSETADNIAKTKGDTSSQSETTGNEHWRDHSAAYANWDLDDAPRCSKRKHTIWTYNMPDTDQGLLQDDNYYYAVQAHKVMQQPHWFLNLATETRDCPESDPNDVKTWPSTGRDSEYIVQHCQGLSNIESGAKTEWEEPGSDHDSANGWRNWTDQSDKQDAQFINSWQQQHRQQMYPNTEYLQQDMLKMYQERQDLVKYVEYQQGFRENLDMIPQSIGKSDQNAPQYYCEIPPLFQNMLDAQRAPHTSGHSPQSGPQRAPHTPGRSPQSWPRGTQTETPCEDPCALDLPEMDPHGCEGCEARWPAAPQLWTGQQAADAIRSEDVLRELEVLESAAPPSAAPVPALNPARARWVQPHRLLEWLLTKDPAPDGVCTELDSSSSSGASVDEFMRGAHCCPHSTEIELNEEPCGASRLRLARRPVAALQAQGAAHARALHALAKEIRAREAIFREKEQRTPALANYPHHQSRETSSEEFPTRDIGLHASPDTFLSGSHRNHPGNQDLSPSTFDDKVFGGNGVVVHENKATSNQVNILYDKITSAFKTNADFGFNGKKRCNEASGANYKDTHGVTPASNGVNCNQRGVNCNEFEVSYKQNVYGNTKEKWDHKVKEVNNNDIQFDYNDNMIFAKPNSRPEFHEYIDNKEMFNQNGVKSNQRTMRRNCNEKWNKFDERGVHVNDREVNVNERGVIVNERGVIVNERGVIVGDCLEEHLVGRGRGRLTLEYTFGFGRGRGRI